MANSLQLLQADAAGVSMKICLIIVWTRHMLCEKATQPSIILSKQKNCDFWDVLVPNQTLIWIYSWAIGILCGHFFEEPQYLAVKAVWLNEWNNCIICSRNTEFFAIYQEKFPGVCKYHQKKTRRAKEWTKHPLLWFSFFPICKNATFGQRWIFFALSNWILFSL